MQRFWESVIEPVFEIVQPEVIVEIGSDLGGNTENLLGFCRQSGAKLHVIDPAPGYDVSEWQREHGEHLVFHKDLSLNALPSIENFDAVLIDGDHNWYTVFHELKLIEKLCDERSQDFPLVMLHDIGWPYGRRDLYYAPETIPEEYRKPYAKKGLLPGVPKLLEEGGMNQHLYNALRDNEPRDGVLTAVEDFLDGTEQRLEFIKLPGIHGLGILIPTQLKEGSAKLRDFLENLHFSPFFERYIEMVERDRLSIMIQQQEERAELKRRLAKVSEELREKRQQLQEERQTLQKERQTLRKERQRLKEANQKQSQTNRKLRQADRDVAQLIRWIEELDGGVSVLLNSRQLKVGLALKELQRKSMSKPEEPAVVDNLEETLEQFRAWRKDRNSHVDGSSAVSDERKESPERRPGERS